MIDPHDGQFPIGLIAQLVEHCTGIGEVTVRVPAQAWNLQTILATP